MAFAQSAIARGLVWELSVAYNGVFLVVRRSLFAPFVIHHNPCGPVPGISARVRRLSLSSLGITRTGSPFLKVAMIRVWSIPIQSVGTPVR
jgi:hypothetical protein